MPGSSAFTDFAHRSTFLMPLKNKGLKEERVAKVGVDHLDKSTTLESNKGVPLLVEVVSCLCKGARPDLSWLTQHESLPVLHTP